MSRPRRIGFLAGMACLLVSLVALGGSARAATLYDWNAPGDSGHTWTGWTWTTNADGYNSPGWKRSDAIDYGGGGDWRPRTFMKSDCGSGTDANIDTTIRAPSTSSGGSLKLSNPGPNDATCWWGWVGSDTFARLGYTDSTPYALRGQLCWV